MPDALLYSEPSSTAQRLTVELQHRLEPVEREVIYSVLRSHDGGEYTRIRVRISANRREELHSLVRILWS